MTRALTIPATDVLVKVEDTTVDLICFEHAFAVLRDRQRAGQLLDYVSKTFEANPGLAGKGTFVPLGTRVHLPEFTIAETTQTVRLWD